MADFIETSNTKTAVRELIAPIADVTTFNTLVQGIITGNPFGCTAYTAGDVPQDPVMKGREAYTSRVIYQDPEAKVIGLVTARSNTIAGFNAGVAEVLGNAALTAAMGGSPARDEESETYSCALKCHDANGELYTVTLTRDQVRISSYSDDAIKTAVETWADTKPELA